MLADNNSDKSRRVDHFTEFVIDVAELKSTGSALLCFDGLTPLGSGLCHSAHRE